MNTIKMVDLEGQYSKIKSEVDEKIAEIINSGVFVKGREVKLFEEELAAWLGVKNVICCANGTDALQIAMMALDLKPGDEVITPDFTFIATAEVIALLGLKPVFVDVDLDTFNIDPSEVEKAITPRTKAIVPVHLFGQCADMNKVMEIAKAYNLYVIEDNAQAIGADFTFKDGSKKKAGTIGHIGTTSFFPSKNLGCYGDGGAVFTNDNELAVKIRMIANHGMSKQYVHDVIGINSRLDTLQAGILRVKLKYLDQYIKRRQRAAEYYDKAFQTITSIPIPVKQQNSTHVFHQYTFKIQGGRRDELRHFLIEKQIPAMIYYPIPLHRQKAFSANTYDDNKYKNTNSLSETVLSLPMHTELGEDQLEYIVSYIRKFFNQMM
jgi:UDP-2-acetamido-2-deoxy-ribo-hexuluronate aminotransferase